MRHVLSLHTSCICILWYISKMLSKNYQKLIFSLARKSRSDIAACFYYYCSRCCDLASPDGMHRLNYTLLSCSGVCDSNTHRKSHPDSFLSTQSDYPILVRFLLLIILLRRRCRRAQQEWNPNSMLITRSFGPSPTLR